MSDVDSPPPPSPAEVAAVAKFLGTRPDVLSSLKLPGPLTLPESRNRSAGTRLRASRRKYDERGQLREEEIVELELPP
jgi:hypothetical protein